MIYRNGDKYEGEWMDGKRHGSGNSTYAQDDPYDRKLYSGNWSNDLFSGLGLMIWKTGEKYEGQFANGQFNGFGNGLILQGGFLFVFDLTAYFIHNRHRKLGLNPLMQNIQLSDNGLGFKWNLTLSQSSKLKL
jgi:hypothetical protein